MCQNCHFLGASLRLSIPAALALAALMAGPAPGSVTLVGHYRLDDTGTTILDSGPYALDGTRAVGNASTGNPGVTHVEGTAAAGFADSANHTIDLGTPSQLDFVPQVDEFSASTWIRFSSTTLAGTIFSKAASGSRQYQFGVTGGDLFAQIGGVVSTPDTNLSPNQVYHVAMSVTTSGLTLYLDGNSVGTYSIGSTTNPGQTVYIGARTTGADFRMYPGWIDDLQIYSGALDPGQVKVLAYTPGTVADGGAVYREIFPNDDGSDASLASEGWNAHYGSTATPTTGPIIQHNNAPTAYDADRVPVNSDPHDTGVTAGYLNNHGGPTTTDGYLYWTEELASVLPAAVYLDPDRVDLISFDARQNSASYVTRVALQIDDQWFVSADFDNPAGTSAFTHSAGSGTWQTNVLDMDTAEWAALTFDPDSTLSIGTTEVWLPGGRITAFGIYQDTHVSTTNARFDNFTILGTLSVPEPGSLALLGLGVLGLLPVVRRRRRRN